MRGFCLNSNLGKNVTVFNDSNWNASVLSKDVDVTIGKKYIMFVSYHTKSSATGYSMDTSGFNVEELILDYDLIAPTDRKFGKTYIARIVPTSSKINITFTANNSDGTKSIDIALVD